MTIFVTFHRGEQGNYANRTPEQLRSAQDTLIRLGSGLTMIHPFMPFLTEELWQRYHDGQAITRPPS